MIPILGTILIPPQICNEKIIFYNSMINIFTIRIRTHLAQTKPDTMQTRHLLSKKVEKWLKRGLFWLLLQKATVFFVSFLFQFYSFVDSVVFFTSSGTSLQWSHRLLAGYLQCKVRMMHWMVLLYCIWRGFEAIVILGVFWQPYFSLDTFALYHSGTSVKWVT